MSWNTIVVNAILLMMSIYCVECSEWSDKVETTIEKHVNEPKAVVHAKRWKNNKNNKNQKIGLYQFSLYNKW